MAAFSSFLLVLLATVTHARKENVPSCDVFSLMSVGSQFFKYAECQKIAVDILSHTVPTVTEMCQCARNEKARLDEFKAKLQCTFWPSSNVWRSTTMYEKLKMDCDRFPQPAIPWIADTSMHIFTIPKNTNNQAMEVEDKIVLNSDVLTVDEKSFVGLRFPNLLVSPGDRVDVAYLGLMPAAGAGNMNTTMVTVSVQDSVNPGAYSKGDNDVTDRSLVKPAWTQLTVANAMAPQSNAMFADVGSMVRAITERVIWKKGNPISFILDYFNGAELRFYGSDSTDEGASGPVLVVMYLHEGSDQGGTPSPISGKKTGDNGDGDGDESMSGGSIAAIVICTLISLGCIAFACKKANEKGMATGFTSGSGFKRFGSGVEGDQTTDGQDYKPPSTDAEYATGPTAF